MGFRFEDTGSQAGQPTEKKVANKCATFILGLP
jgi:hypothetical protein